MFRCLGVLVGRFYLYAELHIAFCPILSTPFNLYALNPFSLFLSFLSKLQIFSCLEHFFVEKV